MPQPQITLSDGVTTLALDPDLYWSDEYSFAQIEQAVERSVSGALIVYQGVKSAGRPITLQPPDDSSAWMRSAALSALRAWEANPSVTLTLNLRGVVHSVIFRRADGPPIEASPVTFVADYEPGDFGDWWRVTLRFLTV